jgi:hypothetical protein
MAAPFIAISCSASAQTQAAKCTAQTEAAKILNEEFLKIMCKIKLHSLFSLFPELRMNDI